MVMGQNATEFAPCRSTGYGRLARAPESRPRARASTGHGPNDAHALEWSSVGTSVEIFSTGLTS